MDTRVLYITALVFAVLVGSYYYFSGKGKKLDGSSAQSMTYSAKNIQLLQTDEKGLLHVKATVDELEQDMKNKTSQLTKLNASMFSNNQLDSTFLANKANGFNDNEKIILSDQVVATRKGPQGDMILRTDELTGFTKLRTLQTDKPVNVQMPNGQFVSQGLQADLNKGQYEFENIRGTYAPN